MDNLFIKVSGSTKDDHTCPNPYEQFIKFSEVTRITSNDGKYIIRSKNCLNDDNRQRALSHYIVHEDSVKTIEKIIEQSLNYHEQKQNGDIFGLLKEILTELKFNPDFGNSIQLLKENFNKKFKVRLN